MEPWFRFRYNVSEFSSITIWLKPQSQAFIIDVYCGLPQYRQPNVRENNRCSKFLKRLYVYARLRGLISQTPP